MKNLAVCAWMTIAAVLLGGCDSEHTSSAPSGNPTNPTPSPSSGSAALTWEKPNQNADGNCLTEVSGYQMYRGPADGNYTHNETINAVSCSNSGASNDCGAIQTCTHTVTNLPSGTWYFSLQAIDANGDPSGYSNVASIVVP